MAGKIVQLGLFGGDEQEIDIDKEKQKAQQKKKRSEAAKKAAETKRKKQEAFTQKWKEKMYKARETKNGNLFGDVASDEERKEAEDFIQKYDHKGKERKKNESVNRVIKRLVNEEVRRVLNENRQYTANDIYREVLDKVHTFFGEIEVCILRDEYHIPSPDDYLRADFPDENTLRVEYKGDKREIPCDINLITEKPEYVARLIMQGFAKIVYKMP